MLSVLPESELKRLVPHLQSVHFKKGTVLYHAGEEVRRCYFPLSGMISILSATENGKTVEVSMVGNEGITGIPAVLHMNVTPFEVMVQISSDALEIKADLLKAYLKEGGKLQELLLRYTHALLCQISQSAVCNRFHTVEQRFCRWLLITRDRAGAETFSLTQEFVSHMLGVPRTNVTMTASALQQAGLISYRHGRIQIVDRKGLEKTSCECYRIVKREIDGFYR